MAYRLLYRKQQTSTSLQISFDLKKITHSLERRNFLSPFGFLVGNSSFWVFAKQPVQLFLKRIVVRDWDFISILWKKCSNFSWKASNRFWKIFLLSTFFLLIKGALCFLSKTSSFFLLFSPTNDLLNMLKKWWPADRLALLCRNFLRENISKEHIHAEKCYKKGSSKIVSITYDEHTCLRERTFYSTFPLR